MKLVMTLLVRDEEDVLQANLDFHFSQGVDFAVVTDNRSEDATPEILDSYARAGLVHVIREDDDDYRQNVWVTRMARMAHNEFGADWVVNCDADEFWWPEEEDLKTTLSAVPGQFGLVQVRRSNFPPCRDESGVFYERMVVRDRQSVNSLGRPLPPKTAHRGAPSVEVGQGNHRVAGVPGAVLEQAQATILHFPLRTYRQFERKIRNGGQAYARNPDDPRAGITWRRLYQEYQEGRLPSYYESEIVEKDSLDQSDSRYVLDQRLERYMTSQALPRPGQG